MARNNIKHLSSGMLEKLNEKYYFDVEDDDIIVGLNHYQRITRHPQTKPFHINSTCDIKRKICFNLVAINFWLQFHEDGLPFSLFDVQQAVNVLTITYQDIDRDSVLKFLKKPQTKIQRQ